MHITSFALERRFAHAYCTQIYIFFKMRGVIGSLKLFVMYAQVKQIKSLHNVALIQYE